MNESILSQIDVYVIAMDRQNRIENIKSQVEKLSQIGHEHPDINIERINAVDGDNIDLQDLYNKGKIKKCIIEDTDCENFTKFSNRKYEVACILSHIKTYNEILQKNTPERYSIILEDDFKIEDDFIETLLKVMKQIKDKNIDFDVLLDNMPKVINNLLHSYIF